MNAPEEDFSLVNFKCFLEEQARRLDHDKASFQRFEDFNLRKSENSYGIRSGVFNNSSVCENMSSQTTNRQTNQNNMVVKRRSDSHVIDSRELQKEKLIESLSLPKVNSNVKAIIKPSLTKLNPGIPTVDEREQEKNRLAEIFASSKPSHFCKTSEVSSKNVNSTVYFNKYHPAFLTTESEESFEGISEQKGATPEIFVSEHVEKLGSKDSLDTEHPAMVRVGEFSPLNPNNMVRRPSLGLGEYSEERRKFMLAQRKQEYNEYLQQIQHQSGNPTSSRDSSPHSIKLKTVATQTEWNEESFFTNEEREIRPRICNKLPERDLLIRPLSFAESPVPKCFDDHCEREVKELLYRQELKNQIEEKNRLKEQMRRREEEEEAKIEAKIQRDLEKMKRQYEEERLQRLELAIRRKEQEDLLRQRLANEQLRAVEENKAKKKQRVRDKSVSLNDKACQKSTSKQSSNYLPLSRSMPVSCASKALAEVNEVLRQPFLEVPYDRFCTESVKLSPPERDMLSQKVGAFNQPTNISKSSSTAALSPRIQRVNEIDNLGQDIVYEPSLRRGVSSRTENDPLLSMSEETAKKVKEVERMLKEPLMPQTDRVLLPVSPPLVHATIPPYIPSLQPPPSPPLPCFKSTQRTNSEILDDKWKVPHTETLDNKPPDVFTTHNRSVLTQLGAFRRHLQQERLRMQQRVRDDSP